MDVDEFLNYASFVEARHGVWKARQLGEPQAQWTDDPIVASRKFTNVFRVLDPGSQYALQLAADAETPLTALGRLFLYRYTNLPRTWDALRQVWGRWPTAEDLLFYGEELFTLIDAYRATGANVFSGAYVILPQPNRTGDKVRQALELTAEVLEQSGANFLNARSQQERFETLRRHYGVGDFMAMQILTDWGYSPFAGKDREHEFVIAGPGSRRGALPVSPDMKPESTIAWTAQYWREAETVRLRLPDGSLRFPSLMDVQNTFCEYSKYRRYQASGVVKATPYIPAHPGPQMAPRYPEHWMEGLI